MLGNTAGVVVVVGSWQGHLLHCDLTEADVVLLTDIYIELRTVKEEECS